MLRHVLDWRGAPRFCQKAANDGERRGILRVQEPLGRVPVAQERYVALACMYLIVKGAAV